MVTRDWTAIERLFQASLWTLIRDRKGEATADSLMDKFCQTEPSVSVELVLYSLGVLAGQGRIVMTHPDEPLPHGEWAKAEWTAVEP